ncbi:MAG: tetratricopeptide repeat protein [Holophagales bacterium]|nr:tetratricopeptide repeat protein [Holophagales bacterium]MYG30293.1 tetratricopeptide repeat protein [Holophagales bacterium]MYI80964.1 tetratricopeptide repeat protein [Holophagales bacterium]
MSRPPSGPAAIVALLLIAPLPAVAQDFAELLEIRRVKETLDLSRVPEPDLSQVPAVDAQRLRDYRTLTAGALQHAAEPMQAQLAANTFGDLCARYLHYELHDAAAVCLDQLRELAPADFQWAYFKLLLQIASGDLEGAVAAAEEALAIRPDDPSTLIRLAELQVATGDIDGAEATYEAAIEAYPESATARIGLGYIALERDDPAKALQIFQEVAASQPEGSEANHHVGLAYRALGDADRAAEAWRLNQDVLIPMYDPLLERLRPLEEDVTLPLDRAVAAAAEGNYDRAIRLYEEILEADETDEEVHFRLAGSLLVVGDDKRAERHLRRTIALNPEHGPAHYALAMFLNRAGRRTESAAHLERAADLMPENLPWRLERAQMRAGTGDTAGAISELEQIVAADPAMIEARRTLAALLIGSGRAEAAVDQLLALVSLTPDDLQARFNLGLMQFETGRYAEARQTLDEALVRFPADIATRHLLARLLATSSDDGVRDGARAVDLAQSVVDEQPALDHLETLAMALAEAGRFDDAVTWQQRALEAERQAAGGNSPQRLDRLALYQARQALRAP